jgi:NAD(P)-dependent dehydrogenase (short-subunit alcohol dehydrogenase family)
MTTMTKNNQNERVALITGASHGIGLELARLLLREGWQVIALNRSELPKDDELLNGMLRTSKLRTYRGDLSDYASLRKVLEEIRAHETRIDVLYNNAGGSFSELLYSRQGRELHYELHTVVPYIIYNELKELLLQGDRPTVVGTSSNAAGMVKRLEPGKLASPESFKKLLGPYADSKLALSLWTQEHAAAAEAEGIRLLSVDPGGNNTIRSSNSGGLPLPVQLLMRLFFPPPTHGAARLRDGAAGAARHAAGTFVSKGAPRALKFRQHGPAILRQVDEIYRKEYLKQG